MSIRENVLTLLASLERDTAEFERPPHSVLLVAVSKTRLVSEIKEAQAAGIKAFGENYLQEALPKIEAIDDVTLEWHFIGLIQSNKTRLIAEKFSWVHTVTSEKIAKRLNDQRPQHLPPLNICLEVNVSQEKTKTGLVDFIELLTLARFCLTLPRLKLRGLMAIPQPASTFDEQRREFRKLVSLKEKLVAHNITLDTLSMGMTEDAKAAIAEGSTIIRIGRGIFGERPN